MLSGLFLLEYRRCRLTPRLERSGRFPARFILRAFDQRRFVIRRISIDEMSRSPRDDAFAEAGMLRRRLGLSYREVVIEHAQCCCALNGKSVRPRRGKEEVRWDCPADARRNRESRNVE